MAFEDFIEIIAPLVELSRDVLHVRDDSHPSLVLQVLLQHELITKSQLLSAQIVEGLRQLSPLDYGLVFGTQFETSVDFRL